MSKERREQIKVCMDESVLDMGLSRLADHAVLMRKDLRDLWAREKLLEAVVEEYDFFINDMPGDFTQMQPALDALYIADGRKARCAECKFAIDSRDMHKDSGLCIDCWHDRENPR